ncbi:TetR/AcrR family transcriptional regulator [Flavobacteriaceae bacterium TP-CH-4]|uniref:TetR/AcrR family transcriptional regulator n=1 Tax=Pelagihabitans pacificus TaxID=2696054 RepID=A0A967E5L0_9FLAO|nr:TetR/AcrR family transcriptional regulator [Pelagihabitans pacificus]NHF58695.1 TetR/AcrR family transcriptional regulator [Pelagihabitans pacificus]
MDRLLQSVKISINEKIFLKDPQSSDLGKRIIQESILMISEMGFESFTFRKLGMRIGSNESSIYRYFENKHKLLLYLTSWYWGWLEYQLVFSTNSMADPVEKLKKAIEIVTRATEEDSAFSHINEVLLNKIVINEYSKSYLTKEVDADNKDGYFVIYKRLVSRISQMIQAVNPSYRYPSSLASTILEGSLHQHFLKDHFTSLTNCHGNVAPTDYFIDLVFNSLNKDLNG